LSARVLTEEQFGKLSILLAEKLEPNLEKVIKELNNSTIEKRKQPIKSILVIYIDIKKFKILNDTYLHSTGDEALKTLAIRLKDSTKRGDMAFRVGGDEFVLLLPITDDNPLLLESIFQRIKNNVNKDLSVKVGDKDVPFEVSMGSQTINRGNSTTAEEILDMADKKMYEAKNGLK